MTGPTPPGARPPDSDDPDAIKAEIDATRERLSQTVDELSARLDVPARAKERARETVNRARDTAVETYRESPPVTLGAALALAGALLGLIIWRRKRAARRRKPVKTAVKTARRRQKAVGRRH